MDNVFITIRSLSNMISEMNKKKLEIKRITKTASLLMMSGLSANSIPHDISERVLLEQNKDGGWVSVVDTMWNIVYLKLIDEKRYIYETEKGKLFLINNKNIDGLWGRTSRDMSRIPVSGILLFLLPELLIEDNIYLLEKLWKSEMNSIVYKAGYSLMAFKKNNYHPKDTTLIESTCQWLIKNQHDNGGFSPWKDHPVDPDVFCTSIAILGLIQYPYFVENSIYSKAYGWLLKNRLSNGIWKFHEIEDGASWGLYALSELKKVL